MVTFWRLWFFNRTSRFEYVFQENSVFLAADLTWIDASFISFMLCFFVLFFFCITKGQEIVLAQHFPLGYAGSNFALSNFWGLFLESPGNFTGPKSNIQVEI